MYGPAQSNAHSDYSTSQLGVAYQASHFQRGSLYSILTMAVSSLPMELINHENHTPV